MRLVFLIIAMLLACCAALPAHAALLAEAFPVPPMQQAEWIPPKGTLPAPLIRATQRVFQQGMADPRGCEYRAVSVKVGSVWSGDGGVVACHGWVLPVGQDGTQWVICWNGLIYRAMSVGAAANVDADAANIIAADEAARAAAKKDNPQMPFIRFRAGCPGEAMSVSQESMLPGKVCMLLRLGSGVLAQRYWACWQAPDTRLTPGGKPAEDGEYFTLAGATIWSMFDRAICAHMRGDDALTLAMLQKLSAAQRPFEQAWAQRPETGDDPLRYLDVVPALTADTQRRLQEPARVPALLRGRKAFSTHAAWVTALVADLDQVNAPQMSQPGGVDLGTDPIVSALISCGDDAVEPLLDCLQHDQRLTRSVHFWRDFAPQRIPIGVSEAAYVALSGILQTSFFSADSTGDDLTSHGAAGRQHVADRIRAYWHKYKGVPLAQRWFDVLANDQAQPNEWAQALNNVTRPVDVQVSPGSMFGTGWVTVPNRPAGAKPALAGEMLRSRQNPSLLELAARRIEQIDQLDLVSSQHAFDVAEASDMALELRQWDVAGAMPVLRRQLDVCVKMFDNPFFRQVGEPVVPKVAALAAALARGGDDAGLKVYGDWLRTLSPGNLGTEPETVVSPLWEFADDPAIADTAQWLFDDPDSSWNPILPKLQGGWGSDNLMHSPLLGLKPVQDQMLRELADQTAYATLTMREDRKVETRQGNGTSITEVPSGETLLLPVGQSTTLRTCDRYAEQLANVGGAPAFRMYWPQPQRDAAIAADATFLKRYAQRLRYDARFKFDDPFPMEVSAHLVFPPLGRCATPADVNATTAIFSLQGQGERRQWPLPATPAKGRWLTLKKYPQDQSYFNPATGKGGVQRVYQQDCWVWQAEEVKVDGKWQRYFGVVGPHEIAQVPGEEMEFLASWPWAELSHSVDCRLEIPAATPSEAFGNRREIPLGAPLLVRAFLRNRLGVAQPLPTRCVAENAHGQVLMRSGMSLSLVRVKSPGLAPAGQEANAAVPIAPPLLLPPSEAQQQTTVETAQEIEVGQFNLRDCAELNKPGDYQLQMQFNTSSGFEGGSLQSCFTLVRP